MHFSKTYAELLLKLPPELRENALEYRRLKKLIKQVVEELTSIGLSPEILHKILQQGQTPKLTEKGKRKDTGSPWVEIGSSEDVTGLPKVVYEINTESDHFEPRLRVLVGTSEGNAIPFSNLSISSLHGYPDPMHATIDEVQEDIGSGIRDDANMTVPSTSRGRSLGTLVEERRNSASFEPIHTTMVGDTQELIILLPSDTIFFEVLMETFQSLNAHLSSVHRDFIGNLSDLSKRISHSARPMSSVTSFHAYSHASNAALVNVRTPSQLSITSNKSDLYSWREIFQLYVDMEVFESRSERTRGERSVEDAEEHLNLFVQRLADSGFQGGQRLKIKESREALQTFLQLNSFVLDLKKFQFATSEATRKILKKHTKRTALPVDPSLSLRFMAPVSTTPSDVTLSSSPHTSSATLSLMLIQAIGETLLPIIPHIDDYSCVICTSIAFKPIRLECGHLFCVRCLVKMQKRGQDHCPMCRAPTVLSANRSNVDWALLNFMKDWFPVEAKKKLQQNEREAAKEHIEELGFKEQTCIIS